MTKSKGKINLTPEERSRRARMDKLLVKWQRTGGSKEHGPFREWAAHQPEGEVQVPDAPAKAKPKRAKRAAAPGPDSSPPQPPKPPGADPIKQVEDKAKEIPSSGGGIWEWVL